MVKKKTLQNGVRVVMERITTVQSVSVGIWVKAGSVNESPEIAGISHLIEHMFFKGTPNRTAKKIAEDLDRIGANSNAFTSKEYTCYYIKTLESNIVKGCEILMDMFSRSLFDATELVKEKDVIYEEIKMIEDSPEDDVHDRLAELVFQGTPYESSIIGTEESLSAIDRNRILRYIEEEYTADSIVISVSGNFNEEELCELFEKNLAEIKPAKAQQKASSMLYVPQYNYKLKEVEQSHVCLGLKSVKQEDDLFYATILMNSVVGGSMSSRLFQNIREEKGLAYSVYSHAQAYVNEGIFSIYAGVSHDKVKDTLQAVAEEMVLLSQGGISEDELSIAKEQFKSNYAFGQENVSTRMFSNGKNMLLFNRVLSPKEVIERVDAVDLEQIRASFQKIIDMEQYSGFVISNKEIDIQSSLKGR